ncbi:MAG: hypothetical protein ACYTG7_15820 [Planctomycetota bacterium]|jgi:hypothetical protein
MRKRIRSALVGTCLLLVPFIPGSILADESSPPLIANGISSDFYLFTRAMHNPERDFLNPYHKKVMDALEESEIFHELWKIVQEGLGQQEMEQVEGVTDKFGKLLAAVDWKALIAEEWVFGVRAGFPAHQYLAAFRMSGDKASKNFQALVALLKATMEMCPFMTMEEWSSQGAPAGVTIRFKDPGIPFQPALAQVEGAIIVASDESDLKTAIALITGAETAAKPLAETRKFKEAFAQLPPAEDGAFYIELAPIFTAYDGLKELERFPINFGPDQHTLEGLMHTIHHYFILPERVSSVSFTEGVKGFEESVVIFCPDWKEKPMAAVSKPEAAIKDFQKFVPQDALSFSVSTGIDFTALNDMLVQLFRELAPTMAEGALQQWDMIQKSIGFDLKEDLFAILEGGMVNLSFPAAQPSPFSQSDSIMLMHLKSREKAQALLEKWIGMLSGMLDAAEALKKQPELHQGEIPGIVQALSQSNVTIKLLPLEVEGVPWGRKVSISVMPFMQPVFGLMGNHLVLASSEGALKKYAAFLEDGGPNILENKSFRDLELGVPTVIQSISFEDVGASYKELGQFLAMSGMFTMMIPPEPETRVLKKVLGLLPRLSPVIQALDYQGYKASFEVVDYEHGVSKSRKVMTYRIKEAKKKI